MAKKSYKIFEGDPLVSFGLAGKKSDYKIKQPHELPADDCRLRLIKALEERNIHTISELTNNFCKDSLTVAELKDLADRSSRGFTRAEGYFLQAIDNIDNPVDIIKMARDSRKNDLYEKHIHKLPSHVLIAELKYVTSSHINRPDLAKIILNVAKKEVAEAIGNYPELRESYLYALEHQEGGFDVNSYVQSEKSPYLQMITLIESTKNPDTKEAVMPFIISEINRSNIPYKSKEVAAEKIATILSFIDDGCFNESNFFIRINWRKEFCTNMLNDGLNGILEDVFNPRNEHQETYNRAFKAYSFLFGYNEMNEILNDAYWELQ